MSKSFNVIFFSAQPGDATLTMTRWTPDMLVTSNVQSSRVTDGGGPPPTGAESNSDGYVVTRTCSGFGGGAALSSSTILPRRNVPLVTLSTTPSRSASPTVTGCH